MCTYVTTTTPVEGSGYTGDDWFGVDRAVVYFDHPQDAPLTTLCVDVGSGKRGRRAGRRLGPAPGRAILGILDHEEVRPLT
jgi:hypothetical protein